VGGVDRHAAETWTSFLVSGGLNGWVYVARAQGVALLFDECQMYHDSNEDLDEMYLHGTVICSQQYHSFLWQWIAICDPWRSVCWIAIHDTRSENRNITTWASKSAIRYLFFWHPNWRSLQKYYHIRAFHHVLYTVPDKTVQQIDTDTCKSQRDHMIPVLDDLHWLLINAHVDNNVALLTYKSQTTKQPS